MKLRLQKQKQPVPKFTEETFRVVHGMAEDQGGEHMHLVFTCPWCGDEGEVCESHYPDGPPVYFSAECDTAKKTFLVYCGSMNEVRLQ
jgi:hypothetical protein